VKMLDLDGYKDIKFGYISTQKKLKSRLILKCTP